MDFRQLEYIDEIAKCQNLTQASHVLFVSQSTLSLYLQGLEKELGIVLFTREKNRLHITPAGELYVETAREVLRMKRNLYDKLQPYREIDEMRVGLASLYSVKLFSRTLAENKEQYAKMNITVTEGRAIPLLRQLEQGTLDFVVAGRNCWIKSKKLTFQPIRKELVVVCIYKDHPYSHLAVPVGEIPPRVNLSIFQKDTYVLPPKDTCDGTLALDVLKKFCPGFKVLCYINDTASVVDMVRHQMGITVLPCSTFCSVDALKDLYWFRPQEDFYRYLQLAYRKNRHFSPMETSIFFRMQDLYNEDHLELFELCE